MRAAGHDPDEHFQIELRDGATLGDVMWRHPDFMRRAERAYDLLAGPTRP